MSTFICTCKLRNAHVHRYELVAAHLLCTYKSLSSYVSTDDVWVDGCMCMHT